VQRFLERLRRNPGLLRNLAKLGDRNLFGPACIQLDGTRDQPMRGIL
jgi:hypothetical protein